MHPKLKSALQVVLGWVTIGVVVMIIRSCFFSGGDEFVKKVKTGKLYSCPNYTVEAMVKSYVGKPKWEHGASSDGKDYVNIRGKIMFNNKEANLVMQFLVVGDIFEFNALEVNDVPQNEIFSELVSEMCSAAAGH